MTLTRSAYLKEMGISEWLARDTMASTALPTEPEQPMTATTPTPVTAHTDPHFQWWFFGKPATGDEAILFKQCLRVLGLNAHELRWHRFDGKQLLDPIATTAPDYPLVAVAFGAGAAQSLSGEKESLPQLRDIVLTLTSDTSEQAFEVPLIASFDLAHLLARPQDKALLWNDLVLAHSVLHNL